MLNRYSPCTSATDAAVVLDRAAALVLVTLNVYDFPFVRPGTVQVSVIPFVVHDL